MSSEVCPFCGKSFKRLKSHLPHCKAAASAQTPASERRVGANRTPAPVAAAAAQQVAESKSPSSPPPSLKKKRQKLSEQIKFPSPSPSPSLSPSSPSSSSPSSSSSPPSVSKPKKTSVRALVEAAKASPPSLEGTAFTPEEPSSGSTLVWTNGRTRPTDATTDRTRRSDAKLADVPTKTAAKAKKAKQAPPTTAWDSVDQGRPAEDGLRMDVAERSEVRTRVFIQDARSILGRAKPGRTKIPDWAAASDDPGGKTRLHPGSTPPAEKRNDPSHRWVTNEVALGQLAHIKALEFKEAPLIPVEGDVPSQLQLVLPETPPPPPPPTPPAVGGGVNGGMRVGRHVTERHTLAPPSLRFSSPRVLPAAPQRAEPDRANHGRRPEAPSEDAVVTQRRLGQVKLRELPDWLMSRTPSHPGEVVDMVQRGWQWYYRRYIDVKKGGVGGLGMLLAGYCVLSYIWSYPHIKLDRWRKYH